MVVLLLRLIKESTYKIEQSFRRPMLVVVVARRRQTNTDIVMHTTVRVVPVKILVQDGSYPISMCDQQPFGFYVFLG